MRTFLPAMWAAFFMRVRPASRKAKPACMNMTRIAAMTTQIVFAAMSRSLLGIRFHLLLELCARSVVRDVLDGRRPDQAVPGLVAATRRIHDRVDHCVRELVLDD